MILVFKLVVGPQRQEFDASMTFSFTFGVVHIENCLDKSSYMLISFFHVGCNAGMGTQKVDNADKKDSLTSVIIINNPTPVP